MSGATRLARRHKHTSTSACRTRTARLRTDVACRYIEAYTNANLTTWVDDFKQTIPKNNLTSTC
jgi:hypothetical protein